MLDKKQLETMQDAVYRNGPQYQLWKMVEEIGELLVAVARWQQGTGSIEDVIEEAGDVLVVLYYPPLIAQIAAWRIDEVASQKIERLRERMGGGAL